MSNDTPDYVYLDDQEPMDTVEMTLSDNPYLVAYDWVRDFTLIGNEAKRETLPSGYVDDPFVLGFVHSSCLIYGRDWSDGVEGSEKFVAEMFADLFADEATARYALALKLRDEADPAFIQGSDNAAMLFRAYKRPEEFADDPRVAIALKRAADHVARRTQAKPGSEEYETWIMKAQDCALHDVFFVNVVSERFPEKTGWQYGTLANMTVLDLSDLDDDLGESAA